VQKDKIYFGNF